MEKITPSHPAAQSVDIVDNNIARLKELFPEAVTEGRIDFEVLRQLLGDEVDDRDEKYGLNWNGKRRARQLALTPSLGTLRPCPEESVDWDTTKNIFIEGDNLEVLKLLQKSYAGKVKLIYIDPPYNTGKDFIYKDDFHDNIKNYQMLTGTRDTDGRAIEANAESSGRFHTDWLSMMYPRLILARHLLRIDGALAISIGEKEISNLYRVCSDIFGEPNIITICSRVMKTGGQKGVHFSPCVDYIIVVAKNIESLGPFRAPISEALIEKVYTKVETEGPRKGKNYRLMGLYQAMLDKRANQRYYIECPDGELVIPPGATFPSKRSSGEQVRPDDGDGVWRWTNNRFQDEFAKGNVEFAQTKTTSLVRPDGKSARWNVYYKIWLEDRLEDGQLPGNILEKFESRHSSAELKQLDIPFTFAKPTELIKYLMTICGMKDQDVILDFFAGSGSTGHAAMKMSVENQAAFPYICVQLPEPTSPYSEERKMGFVTLSQITKKRLEQSAKSLSDESTFMDADLGFRVFKLDSSNIRAWNGEVEDVEEQLDIHINHLVDGRTEQDLLYELLLKLGLDLCVPIEERLIAGETVHSIGGGVLMACLATSIGKDDLEPLVMGIVAWQKEQATEGETQVVFRDSAFDDDVSKANITAILEQNDIKIVRSL